MWHSVRVCQYMLTSSTTNSMIIETQTEEKKKKKKKIQLYQGSSSCLPSLQSLFWLIHCQYTPIIKAKVKHDSKIENVVHGPVHPSTRDLSSTGSNPWIYISDYQQPSQYRKQWILISEYQQPTQYRKQWILISEYQQPPQYRKQWILISEYQQPTLYRKQWI